MTKEELATEIGKDPRRDPETVGTLSAAEIAEGARKAGRNAVMKQNVKRAQQMMEALAEYKANHGGMPRAKLDELTKLDLAAEKPLFCTMADGREPGVEWPQLPGSGAVNHSAVGRCT